MGRLVRQGRAFNCVNVLFTLAFGYWLLASICHAEFSSASVRGEEQGRLADRS